jgi:hypothetical protein
MSSSWAEMKPSLSSMVERTEKGAVKAVKAVMNYVTVDTRAPYSPRDSSGSDGEVKDITWDQLEVCVYNGRLQDLTFHENGFQLVESELPQKYDLDFYNQKDVVEHYYPLCQEILRQHLGEDVKVYAFDHNVRSNGSRRDLENSNGALVQNPLGLVHADYTKISAPKRIQQLALPPKVNDIHRQFLKEGETLLDPNVVEQALNGKRRFGLANVWRNIDKKSPVLQRPLACIDAATTKLEDLRTLSILYADRVGENYLAVHNPEQKWYYFPEMTHNESILLKQWDSFGALAKSELGGLSTLAVHSAFLDPTSPHDAPHRESIEVRCVFIYPEESETTTERGG